MRRLLSPRRRPEDVSGSLVLVRPDGRLPQLDLVSVGVQDPGELPVLVRLGTLQEADPGSLQVGDQLEQIVDTVVDHEGGFARAEPLAVPFCDVPDRDAPIAGLVVGPAEDRAPEFLDRYPEMVSIPRCKRGAIRSRLEEDAADSGDPCHASLPDRGTSHRSSARAYPKCGSARFQNDLPRGKSSNRDSRMAPATIRRAGG